MFSIHRIFDDLRLNKNSELLSVYICGSDKAVKITGTDFSMDEIQTVQTVLGQMQEVEHSSNQRTTLLQAVQDFQFRLRNKRPRYYEVVNKPVANAPCVVQQLPAEVLAVVTSFLDTCTLLGLPEVGGHFFATRDEIVWREVYQRAFGLTSVPIPWGEHHAYFADAWHRTRASMTQYTTVWQQVVTAATEGSVKLGTSKYMLTTGPPVIASRVGNVREQLLCWPVKSGLLNEPTGKPLTMLTVLSMGGYVQDKMKCFEFMDKVSTFFEELDGLLRPHAGKHQ
eukprot:TRINITY_DN33999_c0_g1_i2.p1 TRINITY_DN33999_c0_g1~~TRINITY_DN33999_c0_g1_i2.p1  ORF type:complete len:282 (+),score=11.59 TRINITY_DN33999_c0_g1_i2:119-964(+)